MMMYVDELELRGKICRSCLDDEKRGKRTELTFRFLPLTVHSLPLPFPFLFFLPSMAESIAVELGMVLGLHDGTWVQKIDKVFERDRIVAKKGHPLQTSRFEEVPQRLQQRSYQSESYEITLREISRAHCSFPPSGISTAKGTSRRRES